MRRNPNSRSVEILNREQDYIPGYAGFIHRSREFYGDTFGNNARNMAQNYHRPVFRRPSTKWVGKSRSQTEKILGQRKELAQRYDPLQPVEISNCAFAQTSRSSGKEDKSRRSRSEVRSSRSLKAEHPVLKKRSTSPFIAGYSAFIPKHDQHIGACFSDTANAARWDFQVKHGMPEQAQTAVCSDVVRSSTSLSEHQWPTTRHMIPNYMGHVPDYIFKHGRSFAKLTGLKLY